MSLAGGGPALSGEVRISPLLRELRQKLRCSPAVESPFQGCGNSIRCDPVADERFTCLTMDGKPARLATLPKPHHLPVGRQGRLCGQRQIVKLRIERLGYRDFNRVAGPLADYGAVVALPSILRTVLVSGHPDMRLLLTNKVKVRPYDFGRQRLISDAFDAMEYKHQPDARFERRVHPSFHLIDRCLGGRTALPLHVLLGALPGIALVPAQDAIHELVQYPVPGDRKPRSDWLGDARAVDP